MLRILGRVVADFRLQIADFLQSGCRFAADCAGSCRLADDFLLIIGVCMFSRLARFVNIRFKRFQVYGCNGACVEEGRKSSSRKVFVYFACIKLGVPQIFFIMVGVCERTGGKPLEVTARAYRVSLYLFST